LALLMSSSRVSHWSQGMNQESRYVGFFDVASWWEACLTHAAKHHQDQISILL